jgi:hypothetical protein
MTPEERVRRDRAARRGELAQRLVPKAIKLAGLVHGDGDATAIGRFLGKLTPEERAALPVILAALVPTDRTAAELLAFVTWNEHGEPLETAVPLPVPPSRLQLAEPPCGTPEAFRRHQRLGEDIDGACRDAMRAYWSARNRQKNAKGASNAA